MSTESRMEYKLQLCIRNARECRRASWQEPGRFREEYRRISREAMEDARIWRRLLEAARKESK